MMKIPTPQELGLPPKFDSWRPNQEATLSVIITQKDKRILGMCMPTGSGKSAVNVATAVISQKPTCIVTATLGLQNQYMEDFAEMGMVDIRGRDNYPCGLRDEWSCSDGYAARCPYRGGMQCPASKAEIRAGTSSLVVTNFAKWTSAKRFGTGMDHFQQVIFDEGHEAPEALARAMQIVLHCREIEEILGMDFPGGTQAEDMRVWKGWATEAKVEATAEMRAMWDQIRDPHSAKPTHVRRYNHMKMLIKRLTVIQTANPSNWVVDELERGYVFDPIRPGRYGEAMLLLRMPRIIFTSATIRPKTLWLSGCRDIDSSFHEFASDFNPKDSPIYHIPTQFVDSKHPDNSLLWLKLDQIAAKHQDRKGGIHTVSYERQMEIQRVSRFRDMMFINERGEPPTEIIEQFKESGPGHILCSPSFGTGYDFPGDQLEWNFMVKVPFEPPSKIVKAREHDDPEYRGYKAVQKMDQAFGRGNRYKGDRCASPDTRVLTDNLKWIPAGDLKVGQRLLSITEEGSGFDKLNRTNSRLWEWSYVEAMSPINLPRVSIKYSDRELICTPDHPVLISPRHSGIAKWKKASELKVRDRLCQYLNVWDTPQTFEWGWLSGFTDGEGCLSLRSSHRNPNVMKLVIAQNEGYQLDQLVYLLTSFGFNYGINRKNPCRVVSINGGVAELFRYLGQVRPTRLLGKFLNSIRREKALAINYPTVLDVEPLPPGPIIQIRTSGHTYLTEGLLSHNCANFICDNNIQWVRGKYSHLVSTNFHKRYKEVDYVPPPLPKI